MNPKKMLQRSSDFFWMVLAYFDNPILLKEIRGKFRSSRFLLTHLISVGLLSLTLFIAIYGLGVGSNLRGNAPEELGRTLFLYFFIGQYIVVCLVFPAFSCTAIISEKSNKAFDLLITTTLSPWEIVWGKFTSSFSYVYIFLISTLPLLSISFLFGGVPPEFIFWAYLILFTASVIITVYSLFASAAHTSIAKSIGSTYISILLFGFIFFLLMILCFERQIFLDYRTPSAIYKSLTVKDQNDVLVALALLFHFFVSFGSLFFIATVNRIKPVAANKTTSLRLWFLFLILGGIGIIYSFYYNNHSIWKGSYLVTNLFYTQIALWIVLTIAIFIFTLEPLFLPAKLYLANSKLTGIRSPFKIISPGGISGFWFSFLFGAITIFAFTYALYELIDLNKHKSAIRPPVFGVESVWVTTTIAVIISFWIGQFLLCVNLNFSKKKQKIGLIVAMIVITIVLPLVLFVIDSTEEMMAPRLKESAEKIFDTEASWTNLYYLNPLLILYATYIDLNFQKKLGQYNLFMGTPFGTYPIHIVGGCLYFNIGILLAILNLIVYNKKWKVYKQELLDSGYLTPPQTISNS